MIYLGDSFPDEYRGVVFMNNIHGDRVNNDLLERKGSSFVARHGKDFLVSGDPWFQGLLLRYGPDGSVYLTDWYDTGECHTRKPHEKTGRIYKIAYGDSARERRSGPHPIDLSQLTSAALVKLQLHPNDWFVRRARRLLQERGPDAEVHEALQKILAEHADPTRQLRALWALHVTGGLEEERAAELLGHDQEYVRAWAIQLLAEERNVSDAAMAKLIELARNDRSPVVRLYLAAAMQRVPFSQRLAVLEALVAREEDATDPNLPFMYWYAIEPLVKVDAGAAVALTKKAKIPTIREWIARRLAS